MAVIRDVMPVFELFQPATIDDAVRLLDQHGSKALRRAILAAQQRNTPRASSVAFLLRSQPSPPRLAVDLSHNPVAQSVDVRPHDLETYDELAHNRKRSRD